MKDSLSGVLSDTWQPSIPQHQNQPSTAAVTHQVSREHPCAPGWLYCQGSTKELCINTSYQEGCAEWKQLQATSQLHCCVYDPCLISCMSSKPPFEKFSIASRLPFLFFFSLQMLFSMFLIFCFGGHHRSFWYVYTQFRGFSCDVEQLQLWVWMPYHFYSWLVWCYKLLPANDASFNLPWQLRNQVICVIFYLNAWTFIGTI